MKSLHTIISGGEPLQESLKDEIIGKGYRLYNHYGPTETTVDALFEQCSGNKVSLGKSIDNVKCYILDRYLKPVPVGIPGELHISGAGVARGYMNRPELNHEKIVSNLFVKKERMYRSGDLARFL
jgi:non-ribosomal peptide synthetase component F